MFSLMGMDCFMTDEGLKIFGFLNLALLATS